MQRKIELRERTPEISLFDIDEFSFRLVENDKGKMIKYFVELKMEGESPVDVRFLVEEMIPDWEFLLESPKELIDYIRNYEEDKNPNDESLFHDLRTKYIEFLKRREPDSLDVTERIMILGFSVVEEKVYMVIKTFSLNVLSAFLENLKKYCGKNEIAFTESGDIRWIELEQYVVKEQEPIRGIQSMEFLEKTLVEEYFSRFMEIFKKIDKDGYFKKKFYDKVMFQEIRLLNGKERLVPINQISKFFSSYWKYTIHAGKKEVLCLHDEKPEDEKIDEYVYTFKPSLLGYYMKNWFEDFTVEIIKRMNASPFEIVNIMAGNRFNFWNDENAGHEREIDVVIGVKMLGMSKLIAIECKKTLSHDEIKSTKRKSRERVLASGNNVFDAFVHIGCFSNGITFEKTFPGTDLDYNYEVEGLDGEVQVPNYAFDISSIEEYEKKLWHVIKHVFEEW